MADTGVHDAQRLKELQALPLGRKIQITQTRIIEWYLHFGGNVCVSFSGGKDSTVLLHIARQMYPDIPAVFSNTGLEYPEIQKFVKTFPNVDIVTPEMRFDKVIQTYGYPLIGKEVAEAIYYARRLRSQTVQVERERESGVTRFSTSAENSWEVGQPYRDERSAEQTDNSARQMGRPPRQTENRASRSDMLETDRRRDNLCGKLHGRDWKLVGGRPPLNRVDFWKLNGSGRNCAGSTREAETAPG